uniref:Transactivator/viroplasmin protein n=1 Tax=Cauliflower mosaic virus TaxID=10641 RepID=A0A8D6AM65_9VIRU|nr:inclusion body protein [Cauliflower mosaic virus]
MEDIEKLLLQEKILMLELDLVRAKISLARAKGSMQQGGNSLHRETPVKEEAVHSALATFAPIQAKAIPEQTAPGKESTNPLMVSILPKDMKSVQTEKKRLVTPMDFLRPNQGIQIPQKSEPNSSVAPNRAESGIQHPHSNYYVVYNGPHAGIYDDWGSAKAATNGVPGVAHKKFATITEARAAADVYTTAQQAERLNFIPKGEAQLKPKSFVKALTSPPKQKAQWLTLGVKKPSSDPAPKEVSFDQETTMDDFLYLYDLGRRFDGEGDDTVFTTDNESISLFNFRKNANPEMIREAYNAGLIRTIYPSNNLQEIKYLPKKVKDAVKKFRTNCIKNTEKDIFLKIKSTIPVWQDQGLLHKPKHVIEIGVSKKIVPKESKAMESKDHSEDLIELATKTGEQFIQSLLRLNDKKKIFVNLVEHDTLVYSKNTKETVSEDQRAIETFQQRVITGNLLGFHCPSICHFIKRTVEKEGGAYKCHHCDKGKAIVQDASADSKVADKEGPPLTTNVEKEDVSTTSSKASG